MVRRVTAKGRSTRPEHRMHGPLLGDALATRRTSLEVRFNRGTVGRRHLTVRVRREQRIQITALTHRASYHIGFLLPVGLSCHGVCSTAPQPSRLQPLVQRAASPGDSI